MKSLLIVLLVGFAASTVVPDEHLVVHETLLGVQRSFEGAGRLWLAVDMPEHAEQLNAVERHMKTKLGEFFKEILQNITSNVRTNVDNVRDLTKKVTGKVNELKQKLIDLKEKAKVKSEETAELIKKSVIDIVKTIEETIRKQTENLDEQLDKVSKMKISDMIKKVKERITKKVQDIRDYVDKEATDNKVARELKKILDQIDDEKLINIMNKITDLSGHEVRHLKDLYNQLKKLGKESSGVLQEKISDLVDYLHGFWKSGVGELTERFAKVKATLVEVIGNTKDFSVDAVKEALKHLDSYKEHLGDLYENLVNSLKKAIGNF